MSTLFTLEQKDFVKGLIMTVFTAALTVIVSLVQQPEFSLFNADWVHVGSNVVNVCCIALVGYLAKNFLTDSNGDFLGAYDEV